MNNKKMVMFLGLGAIKIVRSAYAKVFQSLGWQVYVYDPQSSGPILDFMKRVEPQVLFFGSWELDRATVKSIQQRPELELIMWTSNYGEMDKEIIASGHEVLRATDEEKTFVEKIRQTNKLDRCFQYYSQRCMEQTHNFWRQNLGLEIHGVPLAACVHDYPVGEYNGILASSVGLVSGIWKYKAQNLKKYIYPLANISELNLKIFGYGDWGLAQHCGMISTENMKHLFASSVVCPAIYEPLCILGTDISERPYKILSSGGFCISQWIDSAANDIFTNDEMVFVHSPEEFIDRTLHFIKNPDERIPYIERGIKYAYSSGTYYHRMRDIATQMGWIEEIINLNSIVKGLQDQIPQLTEVALKNAQLNGKRT